MTFTIDLSVMGEVMTRLRSDRKRILEHDGIPWVDTGILHSKVVEDWLRAAHQETQDLDKWLLQRADGLQTLLDDVRAIDGEHGKKFDGIRSHLKARTRDELSHQLASHSALRANEKGPSLG